jgi:hypothetical protein
MEAVLAFAELLPVSYFNFNILASHLMHWHLLTTRIALATKVTKVMSWVSLDL